MLTVVFRDKNRTIYICKNILPGAGQYVEFPNGYGGNVSLIEWEIMDAENAIVNVSLDCIARPDKETSE